MVSAISFDWFADFGKILTIIERSSQPNGKHPLKRLSRIPGKNFPMENLCSIYKFLVFIVLMTSFIL